MWFAFCIVLFVATVLHHVWTERNTNHQEITDQKIAETHIQEILPKNATVSSWRQAILVTIHVPPKVPTKRILDLVQQLFDKAAKPGKVYVGVCTSHHLHENLEEKYFLKSSQQSNFHQNFKQFCVDVDGGPMIGRKIVIDKMYSNQNFILTLTTNVNVTLHWDECLIQSLEAVYPHQFLTYFPPRSAEDHTYPAIRRSKKSLPVFKTLTRPKHFTHTCIQVEAATFSCFFTKTKNLPLLLNSLPATTNTTADFLLTAQLLAHNQKIHSCTHAPVYLNSPSEPSSKFQPVLVDFQNQVVAAILTNHLLEPLPSFLTVFRGKNIPELIAYFFQGRT